MLRDQLRDISSWMVHLYPEPFEGVNRGDTFNMFSSKVSGPTCKFYTDLFGDDDESHLPENNSENNPENNISQTSSRNSHLLEQQSGTSEDGNSQDSDSAGVPEDQNLSKDPCNRIARLHSCPRFQSFLVTTSSSTICTEVRSEETSSESSFVKVSHSVLEYRNSR